MPRPLLVGNGRILAAFDAFYFMRDFYFPYVGQWNHIMGRRNRIGVWVDNQFAWLDHPSWERRLKYKNDTLVTEVQARNNWLRLTLDINGAVDMRENVYVSRVVVKNQADTEREFRLYFTQNFSIDEVAVGDTALFDPRLHTIYHYKKNRYFMANGRGNGETFFQYATGLKRVGTIEGTFRDCEDGQLSGNAIAQGSVDSAIGFRLVLGPGQAGTVYYWICAGKNFQEVRDLNAYVLDEGPDNILHQVAQYWRTWVNSVPRDWDGLRPFVVNAFNRSLMLTRLHLDARGAIVAAVDSDIMGVTNRDHYCYVWPRDGAFVAHALIRAGYGRLTRPFFEFCADALTEGGYLMHKYNPDGTLGSSWMPWVERGVVYLPVQEDETALVLWALWAYYQTERDLEFAARLYRPLILPVAEFLYSYFDQELGLPRECYDLWEERRGIFTFTAASVYAGLCAAGRFALVFGEEDRAELYFGRAEEIKKGMVTHLYDPDLQRFVRGLVWDDVQGRYVKDTTLESSTAGVFLLGVLPPDDPRVINTMRTIEKDLWVRTGVGGIARYTDDHYFQRTRDVFTVPGNPWIITTLWLAQWYIAAATGPVSFYRPLGLIEWAAQSALESGVMPEQLDPFSGEPLSVAPLAWSHATFVQTVVEYLAKRQQYLTSEERAAIASAAAASG